MGDLEVDSRLERVGEGRYRAELARDWEIWGPNGGYLAVVALRAVGAEASISRPASFAGHFLRVATFDAVDVSVDVVHRGRRSESLRVSIAQGGRPVFDGLARTAAEVPGLEHDVARMPDVPDPETLRNVDEIVGPDAPRPPFPFWKNLEGRPIDPTRVGREVVGPPIWQQWYRFRPRATFDDPFLDAGRSLLLLDTLSWPAACQPHGDAPYQAPNLDVCAWFHRADPQGEWLLVDHESPVAESGLMGTVGRVFARDGRLLASGGAQLLCLPRQGYA